ncbi:hypothetical protein [Corynebacterium alimapuense]|uniref:Uncharacterized protein n=1 Tax=Corynebacterium alimapuense TaxID=1576874 RepID=A0A3M8K8N5_9CORY|nr:hypothetical protein [Corynebacterium alimapuense]RNE49593.1 hypothetical protein C5L39_04420 [Corynebacterium alimapuense]
MQKIAAELRHRELTQEIYNIGDEVAGYIEHLAEAVGDWDAELVEDCLAEFSEILDDARRDSRTIVGDLLGLRQALTSGVRAGVLSASAAPGARLPEPNLLDAAVLNSDYPISEQPGAVHELSDVLDARTEAVTEWLDGTVDWVLTQTDLVARNLDAVSLPHLYARVGTTVTAAVSGWLSTVAEAHPAYTRTMRGNNPPMFLAERARIDAIVASVAAKRAAQGRGAAS